MRKNIGLCIILGVLIINSGCNKWLEEEPKKLASVQTTDQLEALLNNASAFVQENNATATSSTDDTELKKEDYKNNAGQFTPEMLYHYLFTIDQVENNIASDGLWAGEYKKIFTTNLVLQNVDAVTGSATDKQRLKADAHFFRAYSYWVLVNNYALPYTEANFNSPGVPLKKNTLYEESLVRATLKETYDFILAEMGEAQKTDIEDVDPKKPWRSSKKAIAAFLSRYYLFTGDYNKCIEQANIALTTTSAQLKDFKTIKPGIEVTYTNPTVVLKFSELNDQRSVNYYYWPEFYFLRFTYTPGWWYLPSDQLVSLYDKANDLRYKWMMMEGGGRYFSPGTANMYRYMMFESGSLLPSGPTVAEVLLNKAEAQARNNDLNAMNTINLLRAKRLANLDPLAASNQDEAIARVLEERRRELPFSTRWYDIRRFSVNNYAKDDITVVREFYKISGNQIDVNTPATYTLPVGSKRYAVPINGVEIDASKGQIMQNNYND